MPRPLHPRPPTTSKPLKILLVSPEAVPFAKTGGLADVAGALPRELARLGHSVRLIIPRYSSIDGTAYGMKPWMRLAVPTASGRIHASVEKGQLVDPEVPEDRRVSVLAIRHDPYFARKGLYQEAGADYPDNLERFAFFSRAVVELLTGRHQAPGWTPDILHAHEWQTALCIVYMRTLYARRPGLKGIRTLFTLHNLGYQGLFPGSSFPKTGLGRGLFTSKRLEFHGFVNLLKGGLLFADFLSTVSPTYSQEIQTAECGFGLERILRERQGQLVGITNGVDIEAWNPAADRYLPSRYSASDLSGKRDCKAALQREMHLPVRDVPLLVAVSRLTGQKGLDLLGEILPELMALDLQVVLLGTGDPPLEERFRSLHARYPAKIGLRIGFDDGLAHRIEAGGDLFLMPSRYEPCGLNQLYSLRYGTVPVVRRTGGLADTVVPYSPQTIQAGEATGFRFGEATPEALLTTILLALRVYAQRDEWQALMRAGMQTEVSWVKPAKAYAALYRRVLDECRGSASTQKEGRIRLEARPATKKSEGRKGSRDGVAPGRRRPWQRSRHT